MPPRNPIQPTRAIQATEPTTLLNLLRAGGEAEAQGIRQQAAPWVEAVGTAIPQAGAAISAGLKEHRERPLREAETESQIALRNAQMANMESQAADRERDAFDARKEAAQKAGIAQIVQASYDTTTHRFDTQVIAQLGSRVAGQGVVPMDAVGAAIVQANKINDALDAPLKKDLTLEQNLAMAILVDNENALDLAMNAPEIFPNMDMEKMQANPEVSRKMVLQWARNRMLRGDSKTVSEWSTILNADEDTGTLTDATGYSNMLTRNYYKQHKPGLTDEQLAAVTFADQPEFATIPEHAAAMNAVKKEQYLHSTSFFGFDVKKKDFQEQADKIVAGIERGTMGAELTNLGRNVAPRVAAGLAESGFNFSRARLDWQAMLSYTRAQNSNAAVRLRGAVDFTVKTLKYAEALAKEWDAGQFRSLNQFNAWAAQGGFNFWQDGDRGAVQNQVLVGKLNQVLADLQVELAVVYRGGLSPTDDAMKNAAHNLSLDMSKEQLMANIGILRSLLHERELSMRVAGVSAGGGQSMYAQQWLGAMDAPLLAHEGNSKVAAHDIRSMNIRKGVRYWLDLQGNPTNIPTTQSKNVADQMWAKEGYHPEDEQSMQGVLDQLKKNEMRPNSQEYRLPNGEVFNRGPLEPFEGTTNKYGPRPVDWGDVNDQDLVQDPTGNTDSLRHLGKTAEDIRYWEQQDRLQQQQQQQPPMMIMMNAPPR
jgi:hypothetical protein